METKTLFCVLLLLTVRPSSAQADDSKVELGGLRQVKAVIGITDEKYSVEVRFLSVVSFDEASNELINRDKAQLFALQSLAKHLSEGKESQLRLIVQQFEYLKRSRDGKFAVFHFVVPKSKARLVSPEAEVLPKELVSAEWSDQLFTAKSDFHQTIDALGAGQNRLRDAESVPIGKKADTERFENEIAAIEATTADALEKLTREVTASKLLLKSERVELLETLNSTQSKLLRELKHAVTAREPKEGKKE